MDCSFVVYIDESGDEGFRFDGGSSKWFVLSAVVTRKATDLETVRLVDAVRALLKKEPPRKPLHFRDLRHEHRLPYIDHIAKARLRTVSVLMHKPSIVEPEKFDERYRLYFYGVRYLLERVSWLCRDRRRSGEGDGSAEILFSNRSGMSYDELRAYLEHLQAKSAAEDIRIDWTAINPDQVEAHSSGRRMGLQIADAVASGLYYAVQPSQYGHVETRYAQMLGRRVYRHQGVALGYGLKFWPAKGQQLTLARPEWSWMDREAGA